MLIVLKRGKDFANLIKESKDIEAKNEEFRKKYPDERVATRE